MLVRHDRVFSVFHETRQKDRMVFHRIDLVCKSLELIEFLLPYLRSELVLVLTPYHVELEDIIYPLDDILERNIEIVIFPYVIYKDRHGLVCVRRNEYIVILLVVWIQEQISENDLKD